MAIKKSTFNVALHPIDVDPLNKDKGFVVSQKNFEETKKLIETFKPHLTKQIVYMSYEGSTVILVLLALAQTGLAECCVNGLPEIDRDTITAVIPTEFDRSRFFVVLNKYKDFVMKFYEIAKGEDGLKHGMEIEFINTVQNSRYEDIHSDEGNVEDDGVKVKVDGIPVDKRLVQKVVNGELPTIIPHSNVFGPLKTPIDIKSVNKNAYEIRTDILAMAIDWLRYQTDTAIRKRGDETLTPVSVPSNDEVLTTAKEFYSFVENRR